MTKSLDSQPPALAPIASTSVPNSTPVRPWTWLLLALVLAAGGAGFMIWRSRSSAPPGMMMPQAFPVELQVLEPETIRQSSTFLGALDAEQGVVLRPEIDGRITQIYLTAGTVVAPGDPIVQLSPDRPQAQVGAANANISVAQAALTTAEAQARSAVAEQARATAELTLQQEQFQRTAYLVEQGAQSEQQLDLARRDRDAATASLNAATEQTAASRAAVQQAAATLNQAQAQATATQQDLQDTLITAPIAGTVGDIPVKLGAYVQSGDMLTTITQNQTLVLDLVVPIERRPELRSGLQVELLAPGGTDVLATGQISFISPQVNASTQSVLVKATFANARGLLQDDLRVEARVIWQEQPGVLIPASAISRLGDQAFVYVATPPEESAAASPGSNLPPANGAAPADQPPALIAQQRAVVLGDLQGNSYQVVSGVEAGETIVVSGILNLTDGVPIQPQPNPPTGAPTPGS